MAKAPKFRVIFTPVAASLNAYLDKPDTEAPEGASWKPNGKFKVSQVFETDEPALAELRTQFEAEGKAQFPQAEHVELPFKDGREGTRLEGHVIFTAQSTKEPECFNARARQIPSTSFSRHGDKIKVKVALIPWEKEDEETIVEGGKKRKQKVKVYGIAARIYGVQLVEKRVGGAGGGGFDEIEGGYDGDGEDPMPQDDAPRSSTRPPAQDDDEIPF